MNGRRIPVEEGADPIGKVTEPGDYYGPVMGFTGDVPAVFFLKPHARDPETKPQGRSIGHVTAPPHTFIENADGSLTIQPSISNLRAGDSTGASDDGWHGYLENGIWRQV